MELKGAVVNFLGDSITEGVGASVPENRFTDVFAREFGAKANNYGVSGSRIARQIVVTDEEYDRDYCLRMEEMDPDADVVVVFGGTNDFGHGDAPFGTFDDRTPDTFCGATHTLVRTLIERYPHAEIVFITPLHRLNENCPTGDNKPAPVATLKDYVDAMRRILEYYSVPVLDLYAESGLQPAVPVIQELYMPDGLHPSDAGNAILARRIIQFLKNL